MAVLEAEPIDQFQIGDEVLYLPEQVITAVSGYVWKETFGDLPRILLYTLECGISVPKDALNHHLSDRIDMGSFMRPGEPSAPMRRKGFRIA